LKESSVTKISADDPRSSTPWPRGNPRQPVLDRLDDFEKHFDQLIGQLSQRLCSDSTRSNFPSSTSNPRLPLSDIVFTVYVTACVTLTTVLSLAFLLR
jgi:hypothetical protein